MPYPTDAAAFTHPWGDAQANTCQGVCCGLDPAPAGASAKYSPYF